MANSETIIWTVKQILNITPKGYHIFLMELDKTLESNYPITIFPEKWDKYIKVLGFVWKDLELLEGFNIRLKWNFEERNSSYVRWDWTFDPKLEFKIEWWSEVELIWGLNTLSWIRAYLVRYIPWVWEAQADQILKQIPIETLVSTLDWDNALETLLSIKGIWQLKWEKIKEAWDEWKVERDVLIELWSLGLSINKCSLVYKTWRNRYKDILADDPYRLTEIRWIGFALADEVAMNYLNIGIKDSRRYAWIVEYIIRKYAEDNWDTIISINSIKEWIKDFISHEPIFLNKDIDIIAKEGIEKSIEKKSLFQINDLTYSLWYYAYIETQIAKKIQEWISADKNENTILMKFLSKLKETTMTAEQLQAVEYSYTKKLSIINWWAWTWKTFTVWKIVEWLQLANEDYYIVTPTNKAKSRVLEVNPSANASTIHSLLGIKPWEDPMYNKENLLPFKYLLIDETSMLDNKIWNLLLNAIDFNVTTIIFIWDPKQLPPVWAWSFYYDLIKSWIAENNITLLSEVKRANDSVYKELIDKGFNLNIIKEWIHNIVANSLLILDWKMPVSTGFDCISYLSDFTNKNKYSEKTKFSNPFLAKETVIEWFIAKWIDVNGSSIWEIETLEKIEKLILWMKSKWIDVNKDFQLYIPTYKWGLWILKVNTLISNLINSNEIIKLDRGQEFKIWEKIMYSENDKELELTKWDIWIIESIDSSNNRIIVNFYWQGKKELSNWNLDNLSLGYAISVHKAQWTEVKFWWIILTWSSWLLLSNELLYTAYTRWKEKVFLFWDESAYKKALKTHINARNTLLFHLLANNPLEMIKTNVTRKQWGVSLNELKQIKWELDNKLNLNDTKIIKIDYENNSHWYTYYRYLYVTKDTMWKFELYEGKKISDNELQLLIDSNEVNFLRLKKYNSEKDKRWAYNKVVTSDYTHFVEINSYNKDIFIS